MVWIASSAQDVGNRRRQEDRWGVFRDGERLFAVVADGMGGMPLGAEAAEEAVRTVGASFRKGGPEEDPAVFLFAAARSADRAVREMAGKSSLAGSVGTTLVAALAEGDRLWWVSIGDSRVYLFRKGLLRQLSRDHTVAEELRESGPGKGVPARGSRFPGPPEAITSFIGGLEKVSCPESPLHARDGDCILLASDGLFNTLSGQGTATCLGNSPADPAQALVSAVLAAENPRQDNVTVVALRYMPS